MSLLRLFKPRRRSSSATRAKSTCLSSTRSAFCTIRCSMSACNAAMLGGSPMTVDAGSGTGRATRPVSQIACKLRPRRDRSRIISPGDLDIVVTQMKKTFRSEYHGRRLQLCEKDRRDCRGGGNRRALCRAHQPAHRDARRRRYRAQLQILGPGGSSIWLRQRTRWLNVVKTLVAYRLIDPGARLSQLGVNNPSNGGVASQDRRHRGTVIVLSECRYVWAAVGRQVDVEPLKHKHLIRFRFGVAR